MSTIITALTNFGQSLAAIGLSSLHSVLAVFQAVFGLVQNTIENILKLGQSISTLVLQLLQGVVGFVIGGSSFQVPCACHDSCFCPANFVAILAIGGAYYLYMLREQGRGPKVLQKKSR